MQFSVALPIKVRAGEGSKKGKLLDVAVVVHVFSQESHGVQHLKDSQQEIQSAEMYMLALGTQSFYKNFALMSLYIYKMKD